MRSDISFKTCPHRQDFFPIKSVTKSSTARFSHQNLVGKLKIFVQDFVPRRTALMEPKSEIVPISVFKNLISRNQARVTDSRKWAPIFQRDRALLKI